MTEHLSLIERLYHRFRDAFKPDPNRPPRRSLEELLAEKPASPWDKMARQMNPPPPPASAIIDWNQAPDGFHIWRFHEAKNVAVWLNGKHKFEEWGMVWEAVAAPTFGVTTDAKAIMTPEQGRARNAFKRSQALGKALPAETAPTQKGRF